MALNLTIMTERANYNEAQMLTVPKKLGLDEMKAKVSELLQRLPSGREGNMYKNLADFVNEVAYMLKGWVLDESEIHSLNTLMKSELAQKGYSVSDFLDMLVEAAFITKTSAQTTNPEAMEIPTSGVSSHVQKVLAGS